MAPWLLFGFLVAGVLAELIPVSLIRKHLSSPSWFSICKSVILGIPLPLCSCGVIPVAASLRQAGASKGAVAAFTASTPQTGVDSISTTYSLMGLPFTLGRIAADVISGFLAGSLINLFDREKAAAAPEASSCCGGCCSDAPEEPTARKDAPSWKTMLRHGLIDLPRDIGVSVLVGILLGALLVVLVPEGMLEAYLNGNTLLTYALVTALSIPVYACSVGSIPVAFGLLAAGISPGAAIVFLVTGPATNTATVTTLFKLIGKFSTGIYLLSLVVGAWSVGLTFDWIGIQPSTSEMRHTKEVNPLGFISAVVLCAILANALRLKLRRV
ncbi:MAG: permease [Verrucomicrobiota bacterium]